MNNHNYILVGTALSALAVTAYAQGTFQNLDFEATKLQQSQPIGHVAVADALPCWDVFLGANQQTQIWYNNMTLGATFVDLLGQNGVGIYSSIEGGFSVLLQGGITAASASISQTGFVPVGAQSIRFRARPEPGSLLLSMGGQSIPFIALEVGSDHTLYGAQVSAFSGQIVELRFSALMDLTGPNNWILDSITFSEQPIPEPASSTLLALGMFAWCWRMRRSL